MQDHTALVCNAAHWKDVSFFFLFLTIGEVLDMYKSLRGDIGLRCGDTCVRVQSFPVATMASRLIFFQPRLYF